MEQASSSNRTWNSPLTANGRAVIYVADKERDLRCLKNSPQLNHQSWTIGTTTWHLLESNLNANQLTGPYVETFISRKAPKQRSLESAKVLAGCTRLGVGNDSG